MAHIHGVKRSGNSFFFAAYCFRIGSVDRINRMPVPGYFPVDFFRADGIAL